jgi:TP901 family phage tail tape measure protein
MSLSTLFETQVKIGISDADFKKGIAAAGTAVKDFALMGGRALADFAKDSISTGEQFDKSMAQVAATMGQTVDEITELRDFAKEMGSTTAFSASQAADALNYMALAGYDAATSMEMLPNVLNLAAAGGIELANASDMVTDAQSALGLSIEDTTALVDKMATTASKSNTSVAQLGQAILTVGGTAKNLKGGTTELATVLGILADNGIKGAEGGTALRNVMNSLIAPTESTQAVLDELGVAVFDAEGNIRSFNDIFLDLRNGMDKLTQQERMKAMSNLFNTRDMKSAEALIANVGDRYNELSGYIDNAAGSAEKMAETQLDTLAGDKTKFQSALEGIKLTISDALTPTLREATQFGTNLLGKLTTALKISDTRALVKAVLNIGKWTLRDIASTLQEIAPEVISFVSNDIIAPIGDTLLNILPDWLGDDIKSIFGSVDSFVKSIDFGKLKSSLSGLGESLEPLVQKLSGGIAWAFENVLKPLGTWIVNDAIPLGIDLISAALGNINNVLDILAPIAQPIWDNFLSPLFSAVGDLAVGSLDILANSLKTIGEAFKDFDSAGFLEDIMNGNFFEDWKLGMGAIGDTLETFGADIDDFFKGPGEKWNQLWQNFGGVVFELKEDLVAAFEAIKRGIEGIGEAIDKHNSFWSSLGEKAYDKIHGIDSNADGGYVSTPRLSWVAEKEPEYIIPESKMDKVFNRNSGDVIININVEGGISSDYDVERLASKLAELNVLQTRAIGGTSF